MPLTIILTDGSRYEPERSEFERLSDNLDDAAAWRAAGCPPGEVSGFSKRYEPGSAVTLFGESSQAGVWGPPNEPDSAAVPEMGTKPRRASGECVNGNSTLGTAALLTNEPKETTTMSNIGDQRNALTIQGLAAQSGPQSYATTVADVHCDENCSRGGHTLACDYKTRSITKASPPSQVDAAIDGPRSLENIVNDIALAEAAQKRLPALRKELDDQLAALGLELRKIRKTKGTTP